MATEAGGPGFSYKNLSEFSILLRQKLKDNPDETLEIIANQFFTSDSDEIPQRALSRAKDAIKSAQKTQSFQNLADSLLTKFFWEAECPSCEAALNFVAFFGPEIFFKNKALPFVNLVQARGPDFPILAKLVEMYLGHCEVIPLDNRPGTLLGLLLKTRESNLTIIGSLILAYLSFEENFDLCFCYIRCLAEVLIKLKAPERRHMFPEDPSLDKCVDLLLSSIIHRKSQTYCETLFGDLVALLGSDSTEVERAYGYTSLGQIVSVIPEKIFLDVFVKQFINFLMRDFDSNNVPVVNALKNVYRAIVSRAKSEKIVEELGHLLWNVCEKLSLRSKVKSWMLPEVMEFIPDSCNIMIPFLIQTAQDCSDGGLVSRCVKTLIKRPGNVERVLEEVIRVGALVKPFENLPTFRPVLEPLFQPTKDYSPVILPKVVSAPLERFSRNWLLFECLRIIIPQKWRGIDLDLESEISYSLRHGNMDLRVAAFVVLSKTKYQMILPESFLFCEVPRYQASVEAAFPEWISNIETESGAEVWKRELTEMLLRHTSQLFTPQHQEFAARMLARFRPTNAQESGESSIEAIDEAGLRTIASEITSDSKDAIDKMCTALAHTPKDSLSEEVLVSLGEKLFDYFLDTKNVLMASNCEKILSVIAKRISSKNAGEEWLDKLVSSLKTFDMENLRRSASLPFIAVCLCHLESSAVNLVLTTLLDVIDSSDIEVEVTHSLNVVRAIFRDKSASEKEEILYTRALPVIASSLLKFSGWDYVSAVNLCLAALLHKVGKRSGDSVTIDQFFAKATTMSQVVVNLLESKRDHATYIGLTILSVFNRSLGICSAIQAKLFPLLGHGCSRMRRAVIRALMNVTPREATGQIVSDAWAFFKKHTSWNAMHTCLMLTRCVIQQNECDVQHLLPKINPENCPPLVVEELHQIQKLLSRDLAHGFKYRELFPYDYRNSPLYAFQTEEASEELEKKALESVKCPSYAVSSAALEYLARVHYCVTGEMLVSQLENGMLPNDRVSQLINLIRWSDMKKGEFESVHHCLVGFAWRQDAKVSLSLAEVFDLIHKYDENWKSIAIPLLLNEVPRVRVMTSYHIDNELKNEIDVVETLFGTLCETEKKEIRDQMDLHQNDDYVDIVFSTMDFIRLS